MQHLIDQLISNQQKLSRVAATIGFDGFIDSIVKIIKYKNGCTLDAEYFNTMSDWGTYILDKNGCNFSVELSQRSIKAGGNMPNMAGALSTLGITVNCVGAMGYPSIDPLFSNMPGLCHLYSFASPGTCQAIEFEDGKIMQASMGELNKIDWNTLKERIPIKKLIEIFDAVHLIGLLNWGELVASTSFWKGLLNDVLPFCNVNKEKIFFVDLADCSNRAKDETLAALELLKTFSKYGKVMLSLNHNESLFIYNALFENISSYDDIKKFSKKIFTQLQVDTLLLHTRTKAIAIQKNEYVQKDSFVIKSPKLLTGAGDNFNAGFCFAQLIDCNLEDSLVLAHFVSAQYIKNGKSISWNDLIAAMKTM
ncbi:MAG: hypothetical protein ABJB86_15430 [Bacteroidota bacterium]